MQICVLNSGSSGNCVFISSNGTSILIDAGISCLQIRRRLAAIGHSQEELAAVFITHDHIDHCLGLPTLSNHNPGLAIYANYETSRAVERTVSKSMKPGQTFPWANFETGDSFDVGGLSIETFGIQHDAADPVGYVVSDGNAKVGVATDMGVVTEVVKRHLRGCDALVMEVNHDLDMLMESDRGWWLKQRISGRNGHLSNEQASELLSSICTDCLKVVFPAHVSGDCNTPELAIGTVRDTLRSLGREDSVRISPTYREAAGEVIEI